MLRVKTFLISVMLALSVVGAAEAQSLVRVQPSLGVILRSDAVDNEDETAVKAGPGVLFSVSGRNSSTTTNAYVRCTNATAANTTPGTTTVVYEMMLPFGGGFIQSPLSPGGRTFTVAITCYVVTDAAVTGTTDAAANEVVVNFDYR